MKGIKMKGFTLIELLVVISIIALLMAIMMPALNRAREQGRFVVCRNNMRNVGIMVAMYAEDNQLRVQGQPDMWMEALRPYYGYTGSDWAKFNREFNSPFECVAATHRNKPKDDARRRTMACNRFIVSWVLDRAGKDTWSPNENHNIKTYIEPKRPSATMFAVDSGYFVQDGPNGTGRYFGCIDGRLWYTSGFYHFGKKWITLHTGSRPELYIDGMLNILYFDGSVNKKRFSEFPFDPERVPASFFDERNASDTDFRMFWHGR
jgi:prepilin-type N-terminal cleavage/methylation domain-containing protein/prepilin-type processing-associated H-X9-DG protein